MEQTLPRSLQKGTKAVHIWISDFWPPGLGEDKYLCFKHHHPPRLWHSAGAARGNWCTWGFRQTLASWPSQMTRGQITPVDKGGN